MAHERCAGLLSRPVDQVGDARRNSGLFKNLEELYSCVRSVLGRFEHNRVAAEQRREELPGRDRHGKVPGSDQSADADRRADRHGELIRQLRGRGLAKEPSALARGIVGRVGPLLNVAARLLENLSHLPGHGPRDLLFAPAQNLSHSKEHLAALGRRHQPPTRQSLLGGADRFVDVRRARVREEADQVAPVGRIAVFKSLAGLRRNPLAADVVLVCLRHGSHINLLAFDALILVSWRVKHNRIDSNHGSA